MVLTSLIPYIVALLEATSKHILVNFLYATLSLALSLFYDLSHTTGS
jgi:hypothetical protein